MAMVGAVCGPAGAQSTADATWDPGWHDGFIDTVGSCALHLTGRRHERDGNADWYIGATLNVPLTGCVAATSTSGGGKGAPVQEQRDAHQRIMTAFAADPLPLDESRAGIPNNADSPAPPLQSARDPVVQLAPPRFDPELMREVVRRVLAHSGLDVAQVRLGDLASRSRLSGLLPELRLRGALGLDQTQSLATPGAYPTDGTLRGRSDALGEVRLTFRLNRLLFGDSEPALERLRLQVVQARKKLIDDALNVFLQWYKFERRRLQRDLSEEQRLEAELAALDAAVRLDVLTAGWFLNQVHVQVPDAPASQP